MRLYIDVETVPGQQPGELDRVLAGLKPPGTLKKAESIAAWWRDEAPAAADAEWRKQALDPAQGELICIGIASDDDADPVTFARAPGESERQLLGDAFAYILQLLQADAVVDGAGRTVFDIDPYFIAHFAQFDLGWLRGRSWALGIRPPFRVPAADARPGRDYGCTQHVWAGYKGSISLDRLCKALRVPSPKAGGMTGADVFDAWRDGHLDRIRTYCAVDVAAVRSCWRRLCWELAA